MLLFFCGLATGIVLTVIVIAVMFMIGMQGFMR